jgi:hypothetical protein
MRGATPPLPNMPSWRGAQLKIAQGQFYLFTFIFIMHFSFPSFVLHASLISLARQSVARA